MLIQARGSSLRLMRKMAAQHSRQSYLRYGERVWRCAAQPARCELSGDERDDNDVMRCGASAARRYEIMRRAMRQT